MTLLDFYDDTATNDATSQSALSVLEAWRLLVFSTEVVVVDFGAIVAVCFIFELTSMNALCSQRFLFCYLLFHCIFVILIYVQTNLEQNTPGIGKHRTYFDSTFFCKLETQ